MPTSTARAAGRPPSLVDLTLRIRPGSVEVDAGQLGGAGSSVDLRVNVAVLRSEVERLSRNLNAPTAPTQKRSSAREVGARLFDLVFSGEDARRLLREKKRIASQTGLGVRLRLQVDPELAAIPWELLYDGSDGGFVALRETSPIVRCPLVPKEIEPLEVELPLKILAVSASPKSLPAIDVQQELEMIGRALDGLHGIQLTPLSEPSPAELFDALKQDRFHVLHFACHGDTRDGKGFIALSNGSRVAPIDADAFTVLLGDHCPRLVVLNACKGAAFGALGGESLATELLQLSIPAVLAMQFAISDEAAITLAQTFYGELARGTPIEAALTRARSKVFFVDQAAIEWATPVLYMRSAEGRLFFPPVRPAKTLDELDRIVASRKGPLVVLFHPDWSLRSAEQLGFLRALVRELDGSVGGASLEVPEADMDKLWARGIRSFPTFEVHGDADAGHQTFVGPQQGERLRAALQGLVSP